MRATTVLSTTTVRTRSPRSAVSPPVDMTDRPFSRSVESTWEGARAGRAERALWVFLRHGRATGGGATRARASSVPEMSAVRTSPGMRPLLRPMVDERRICARGQRLLSRARHAAALAKIQLSSGESEPHTLTASQVNRRAHAAVVTGRGGAEPAAAWTSSRGPQRRARGAAGRRAGWSTAPTQRRSSMFMMMASWAMPRHTDRSPVSRQYMYARELLVLR